MSYVPTLKIDPRKANEYAEMFYRAQYAANPSLFGRLATWELLDPKSRAHHIADMQLFLDALDAAS